MMNLYIYTCKTTSPSTNIDNLKARQATEWTTAKIITDTIAYRSYMNPVENHGTCGLNDKLFKQISK
jgi:hypothetical protein